MRACTCACAPLHLSPVRLCDYIYVCLRFHSTLPFPSMCVFSPVAPSFTFAPHLPSTLVLSGSRVIGVTLLGYADTDRCAFIRPGRALKSAATSTDITFRLIKRQDTRYLSITIAMVRATGVSRPITQDVPIEIFPAVDIVSAPCAVPVWPVWWWWWWWQWQWQLQCVWMVVFVCSPARLLACSPARLLACSPVLFQYDK